jgi:hypothetical protein
MGKNVVRPHVPLALGDTARSSKVQVDSPTGDAARPDGRHAPKLLSILQVDDDGGSFFTFSKALLEEALQSRILFDALRTYGSPQVPLEAGVGPHDRYALFLEAPARSVVVSPRRR